MTEIPNIKDPASTEGMRFRGKTWKVRYILDGRQKWVDSHCDDTTEARSFRDSIYKLMLSTGAVIQTPRKSGPKPSPTLGIYRQKPYVVRLKGKHIGEAGTFEEAKKLRDEHLKTLP